MPLPNEDLRHHLTEAFGEKITEYEDSYGMLTITIPAAENTAIVQQLFDNEAFKFRFLTDLTAVHFPNKRGQELCVVYHLHNMVNNVRLRVKAYIPVSAPNIRTLTSIFSSANWMERETYDFFGVNFEGHPNLIRILNVDEMDYFPMRKEYPMEDPSRRDKDDEMFGRGGTMIY